MPVTGLIMGGISAAGAIGGGLLQSNAASSAAATEQNAATQANTLEGNAATAAEGAVNTATGTANTGLTTGLTQGNNVIGGALTAQQAALQPYLTAGTTSLSGLQSDLTGLTSPSSQFQFNPATSPQLQFEQQQANQALQRQAAAQGTVLGGGEDRASNIMNTGLASTYLNQAFNQALAQYSTNRQNTLTQIQGLTNLTGLGYNAAGALNQDIGNAGLQTNSNIQNVAGRQAANTIQAGMFTGNTGLTTAQLQAGNDIGAANAVAGNQLAQGKIWGNTLNSLTGTAGNLYGLSQTPNFGGYGGSGGNPGAPGLSPNDPSLFSLPDTSGGGGGSTYNPETNAFV
jgi:hypothetical protein